MSRRFGFDALRTQPLEDSINWAASNGFHYIDFNADLSPNDIGSFDDVRIRKVKALCAAQDIKIGVHPSSAVNSAEYVPGMSEAVEQYLNANLELAARLGCDWVVGHGGYHFGDLERRRRAAVERTKRLVERAENINVPIFLENHNREPEHAEIYYLPYNIEELHWFFDTIHSPYFKWAFNVAHSHLTAEGWLGFLEEFGVENIGQIRLNDNHGDYEVHLVPGEGTIDFPALFERLKAKGYEGWFSMGFGDEADKIRVRDWFGTLL